LAGDRVVVGYIIRAHGVRGAVLVRPLTDDPTSRFASGSEYATESGEHLTLRTVAQHPSGLILDFAELADRDAAEGLAGSTLTIDLADRRALADDEYWPEDLIGCAVVDGTGLTIGEVIGYEFGSAQDRLVVEAADGVIAEVPFVDDLVPQVEIARRTVVVDLPEGLFDRA
jgi:16S rRNA processing protein RimM